jgi:hypothetical protein
MVQNLGWSQITQNQEEVEMVEAEGHIKIVVEELEMALELTGKDHSQILKEEKLHQLLMDLGQLLVQNQEETEDREEPIVTMVKVTLNKLLTTNSMQEDKQKASMKGVWNQVFY